ncbi:MAG: recombinase family protein [Angelakisella sp.]
MSVPINVVAYCRVSTDSQDQRNSLAEQEKFFAEFSKQKGYHLLRLYVDEGISGTQAKRRPQFMQLIKDSERGEFTKVLTKDVSRFARNTLDFLENIRLLKKRGIACDFITSNMSSEDGELLLTVMATVAQEESSNTSKRVKFTKKRNAENGRVPNFVYGYRKENGDYFNLTVNEEEAAVVRRIFQLYTQGQGQNKIALTLNAEGIRTQRGCEWSQNAICRILKNEIYTGQIVNGKEEIKDFLTGVRTKKPQEEWLITEKPELLFAQAQKMCGENCEKYASFPKEYRADKYLFSTLIKCACCGYSFRRTEYTYVNTYVRWVCSKRNGNGRTACINKTTIEEQELADTIKSYFQAVVANKESFMAAVKKEFQQVYKKTEDNRTNESELRSELAELEKKRKKYRDLYAGELCTLEEYKEDVKSIEARINRITQELSLLCRNLSKADLLEATLTQVFVNIDSMLNSGVLTNASLKQVLDKIVVDECGNVEIFLKALTELGLQESYTFYDNRT